MSLVVVTISIGVGMASFAAAIVFALCYWKRTPVERPKDKADGKPFEPSVAVILCIRGSDPFLSETLLALTRQSYENFRVLAIVDHKTDPAWDLLCSFRKEHAIGGSRVEVQELQNHHASRGLKCSALLQALESIREEIVVTIDSDSMPKPNWLRSLVQPLENETVGATTGNQWFEPSNLTLGTWVRSVWHAGAIVPTAVLGNAWAGAFAMRREDLFTSGLVEDWSRSIIDDGPVRQCLVKLNKSLRFVPEAISVNREDCKLAFCFRYVSRMLTWSRLFESTFWITFLHMLIFVGAHIAITLLLITTIFTANSSLTWPVIGFVTLFGSQVAGYLLIRATVFSHQSKTSPAIAQIHKRSKGENNLSMPLRASMALLVFPGTLAAYAFGAVSAIFVKEIRWRQICYRVRTGTDVTMSSYQPFTHRVPDQHSSI